MDAETTNIETTPARHAGSCHCGAVRFSAELDLAKGGTRCNCTICTKLGITGGLMKPAAFTLLRERRERRAA